MVFAGPVAGLPAVSSPYDLATGDVDLDGDVDILIGTLSPFPLTLPVLWLNDGTGGFAAAPFPPSPLTALSASDGCSSATSTATETSMRPLVGRSADSAAAWWSRRTPEASSRSRRRRSGCRTCRRTKSATSTATLFPTSSSLSLGPQFVVIRGSPTGFLAPVTTASTASTNALIAVDLNGDGLDELVEDSGSFGTNVLNVRSVAPGGTVGSPTQSWPNLLLTPVPASEAARDLDGDGDRDVIAFGIAEPVVLMNGGAGALVAIGGKGFGLPFLIAQRVCDLDADGDPDVVGWGPMSIATGVNEGTGRYAPGPTPVVSFPANSASYSINPFDVDGDGDSDLYVASNPSTYLAPLADAVLVNNGGSFTQVTTLSGTGATSAFVSVDIDLDGDQDVILGRRAPTGTGLAGPMLLLRNLSGTLSPPIPFGSTSHATWDVDVGDFDGNGLPDLFQTNSLPPGASGAPDPCVLWLNTGSGFVAHVQSNISGFFTAAGELTGDGRTDLVIDGQLWFSTGTAFVPGPMLQSPLVGAPSLVDVDHDGDLDVVETPATVFFDAGGLSFGPPVSYLPRNSVATTPPDGLASAVVDADRDGDLDILAPGPLVLSNTRRQIARGSIARPGRPASIDLYGTPGGGWFLWAANGPTSLPFLPWGIVQIDLASALLGGMGTFTGPMAPLPGTATLSAIVPNNPALIGWTTYWQSVDAAQMRLTNRLAITVLNY